MRGQVSSIIHASASRPSRTRKKITSLRRSIRSPVADWPMKLPCWVPEQVKRPRDLVTLGDQIHELLVPIGESVPEFDRRLPKLHGECGSTQLVEYLKVSLVHNLLYQPRH